MFKNLLYLLPTFETWEIACKKAGFLGEGWGMLSSPVSCIPPAHLCHSSASLHLNMPLPGPGPGGQVSLQDSGIKGGLLIIFSLPSVFAVNS